MARRLFVGLFVFASAVAAFGQSKPSIQGGPRTLDGHPDLEGMWLNFDNTPFERAPNGAVAPPVYIRGSDHPPLVARRPSMVVEPLNGRVPVMAWAEKVRDDKVARIGDTWENGTTWDRCLTRGIPGAIFPANESNAYRIFQSPGSVTILYEMIHVSRVIPTDGSPHLPSSVRLWDGDSRGHWEGDTLVVDITNYNGKGDIATNANSGRIRGIPASDQLHVVERFTRVSDKTINYEVTIDDPKVYTAPWKVAMPLTRDDSYRMFEYECHEGNYYFETNTLNGGREQDATGIR
jgi:hypothetical protein